MEARLRPILTYVFLVALLSAIPYTVIIRSHHLGVGGGLMTGVLMWMPATAALLSCLLLNIDVGTLGWRWRPTRYEVLAYVLPILYAVPVYCACWVFVPHSLGYRSFADSAAQAWAMPGSPNGAAALAIVVFATFGVVRSLSSALGEEIGWRGFLLPRLTSRFGFTGGCLISGCIWAVWHYPALLLADYNSGTPKPYALACFTAMVIAMAFVMGWIRLRSGSLWPCALLHASHNLFVQAIFDRITLPQTRALYLTTEFGFGLAITIGITAVFLTLRHPVRLAAIAAAPEAA
ncbi:MAG TPA: CPBP family intramembrane glutamic endopeptidase [Acidobacteriaceae bacterium]|jgi:membrane protease YdiL (CAAX protease family)|nr:CPBP family intramembrane glutamic endopeptidase [Acidobacteriaceae bacterium]